MKQTQPVERMLRKQHTFANEIKRLLRQEYKFLGGPRLQDLFVRDVQAAYERCLKDSSRLDAGQTVWWAVDKNDPPTRDKRLETTRFLPVILTIADAEELRMRLAGSDHAAIRRHRIARLFKEAYAQGGVLSQVDVGHLLGLNEATVSTMVQAWQREHEEVLPYRGTIHDLGPTLTHKRMIVKQFLNNVPTPTIARKTSHGLEACDRYIKAFKRVRKLYEDGTKPENIAAELDMSINLVKQYVELVDEERRETANGGAKAS